MGPSPWQLIIVLVIVLLLFGTKRLRNIGGDLGGAIKNFKKSMKDGQKAAADDDTETATAEKLEAKEEDSADTSTADTSKEKADKA